jgi:hypothetical protein
MTEHHFTLVIDGDVDAHIDELFEAGCDDAMFGSVEGTQYAEFDREGGTLAHAIVSAIGDVESVNGLRVTRVEPNELLTISELASRLGRSRESVRLLAVGERGVRAGQRPFPAPASHLRTRNKLWRWTDVAAWDGRISPTDVTASRVLIAANAALELRNQSSELPGDAVRELAGLAGGAR